MLYFLFLLLSLVCDVHCFCLCTCKAQSFVMQLSLCTRLFFCRVCFACHKSAVPPNAVGLFYLLPFTCTPLPSLAVKSMQRALSSDTLNAVALSNTVACSHNSDPQHGVRQPLSHSQSMFLPENGKVPAPGAQLCSRQAQKKKCINIQSGLLDTI